MSNAMNESLFAGTAAAELKTPRNPKLDAGEYTVEILATLTKTSEAPETAGDQIAITEVKVLSASGEGTTPVGTTASLTFAHDGKKGSIKSKVFADNVKALVCAAAGLTDPKTIKEKVTDSTIAGFYSTDQKAQERVRGSKLRVRVTLATSKAGNQYRKYAFLPASN